MQLGLIGLGKMGYNLALNFKDHGHQVVVNDVNRTQVDELAAEGFAPAYDLDELCRQLSPQRVIWLMVPAGKITASVIGLLEGKLAPGDIIIDGGNSHFRDSQGHYAKLKEKGIHFLDCGTSGGMDGARNGACTMIGAGRDTREAGIDHAVGLILEGKIGQRMEAGSVLCRFYITANTDLERLEEAAELIEDAFRISQSAPEPRNVILETVSI